MGANHGGAWGGLAPRKIYWGAANRPSPPEKPGFGFSNQAG